MSSIYRLMPQNKKVGAWPTFEIQTMQVQG
jgi:hypothetical protein